MGWAIFVVSIEWQELIIARSSVRGYVAKFSGCFFVCALFLLSFSVVSAVMPCGGVMRCVFEEDSSMSISSSV